MDDTTQNTTQNPVIQPTPAPVDPMDTAQVPDLPVTSEPSTNPEPTVQPAPVVPDTTTAQQTMQQMAADPAPIASSPQPTVSVPTEETKSDTSSSLGPVTMEDLMEELQHIEDKLDEMDEKL